MPYTRSALSGFRDPANVKELSASQAEKTPSRLRALMALALVFAAYVAGGRVGLAVPFTSGNVSPVWPPSGIALAALLFWGYRVWPGIAVGAFLVNFLSPIPPVAAVGIAVGNTSSALLAAYLLKRIPGFQNVLTRLRDVLELVIAAMVSPTIAATIGVTTLFLAGVRPWSHVSSAWVVWWIGDAMGVLVVAPLLLTVGHLAKELKEPNCKQEFSLLAVSLVFTSLMIFHMPHWASLNWTNLQDDVLAFTVFPFVIWAAARFGPSGAATTSAFIGAIAVWATATGHGPFVKHNPLHAAALLQAFMAVISVTGMILAAVMAERIRAEDALETEQRLQRARELAEYALRQSQERMRGIIDSAMDAIITVDQNQRVVVFNKAAEAIFRWPVSEALGQSLDAFIPSRLRQAHREHVATFSHTGITSRSMYSPGVLAGLRRNGEEFPIEATISQVESSGQKLFTVILRDISERKQAEEKLRKSEKLAAAGRMAACVAHEINNPLAAMTNLLYLLQTEDMNQTARHYLTQAEHELGRVGHIVRQTLQFYRDSGNASTANLCDLIDDALDVFSPAIAAGRVHVLREYLCSGQVIAHPAELRQVFANLVANAVEAGATLVRIRVTMGRDHGNAHTRGIRVTILDNGQGLSPQSRQHAFEPFFTTKGEKGTGLGLWVTQGIVRKYEGSIRLRSSNDPGRSGTCVTIFIPSSIAASKTKAQDQSA